MTQEGFERAREAGWAAFEAALAAGTAPPDGFDLPARYRGLCRDLALARDRGFSTSLVDRLNRLALEGHQRLYGARAARGSLVEFFAQQLPAALRREARLLALASLLFYGSAALALALDLWKPDLIYHLMSAERVAEFESMYDPGTTYYGTPRDTASDFGAFAFYASNNIGVALRTFAWGVFFGIGSLGLLVFNGVYLGVVAAHITQLGFARPFYSFVIGHSACELTALVLAAMAGMKLGWALVAPGPRRRARALREAAAACVPILYGAVALLAIAAVIEGFWSSNHALPAALKLAVGGALWIGVGLWIALGGRSHAQG